MTNYDQPTGTSGIVRMAIAYAQSQAGNYTNFDVWFVIVNNNPATFVNGLGWSGNRGGTGVSGVVDINGAGTYNVGHWNYNVAHDSAGNLPAAARTFMFHMNATGTSGLAGATEVGPTTLSIPRIPKAPHAPGLTIQSISGTTVSLKVTAPSDNGGSAITSYTTQYSLNGGTWTGNKVGAAPVYTGLAPGSYQFRTYATNAIGNSPYSASPAAIQIYGSGRLKVGGIMKPTVVKLKVANGWKPVTAKLKVDGVWKTLL